MDKKSNLSISSHLVWNLSRVYKWSIKRTLEFSVTLISVSENNPQTSPTYIKCFKDLSVLVVGNVDSGHLFENKRAAMAKKLLEKAPSYRIKVSWEWNPYIPWKNNFIFHYFFNRWRQGSDVNTGVQTIRHFVEVGKTNQTDIHRKALSYNYWSNRCCLSQPIAITERLHYKNLLDSLPACKTIN